jgi:glycosyltransferase involved in cell wall biosynthesis
VITSESQPLPQDFPQDTPVIILASTNPELESLVSRLRHRHKSFFAATMGGAAYTVRRDGQFSLSVVVPIYGVEKVLPQLLDSLLGLTAPDVQILFVNDGSKDNSPQLIQAWIDINALQSTCKLINKSNGGCFSARNLGLEHASGDYTMFVDGDDVVNAHYILKLLTVALLNNVDIARGDYLPFRTDLDSPSALLYGRRLGEHSFSGPINAFTLDQPAIWTNIYRNSFLQSNSLSFPEFPRFDDLPFHLKSSYLAQKTVKCSYPVYYYRQGRDGQDIAITDNRLAIVRDVYKWTLREIPGQSRWLKINLYSMFATYKWVLSKLEVRLKFPFAFRAVKDIASLMLRIGIDELFINSLIRTRIFSRIFSW